MLGSPRVSGVALVTFAVTAGRGQTGSRLTAVIESLAN